MPPEWPTDPDDPVDPALAPLIEAGEGESEGFELAEGDLIENARHDDQHTTEPVFRDAPDVDEESAGDGDAVFGDADEEEDPDL